MADDETYESQPFTIRNTFIELCKDSPVLGSLGREVQSCPNTALLAHAMPRAFGPGAVPGFAQAQGVDFDLVAAAVSRAATLTEDAEDFKLGSADPAKVSLSRSPLCGLSPEIPHAVAAPWGRDVLEKLVANAAAAVEAHTPTLTAASPGSQPLGSSSTDSGFDPLADLVAAAADAASPFCEKAADESRQKSADPWEADAIGDRAPQKVMCFPATPSPKVARAEPGLAPAFASSSLAPLLEAFDESDDDGCPPKLAACLLESDGPLQSPCWSSPLALSESAAPVPGVVPTSEQEQSPDPGVRDDSDDGEIAAFVNKWGLDQRCVKAINELPKDERRQVLKDFDASSNTKNVNAKFMVWIDSRLRQSEARRLREQSPPEPPSEEELQRFFKRWPLDKRSQRYVRSLPAATQRVVLQGFNPPPDTNSYDAKLFVFVRLQLTKESARTLRLAGTNGVQPRRAPESAPAQIPAGPAGGGHTNLIQPCGAAYPDPFSYSPYGVMDYGGGCAFGGAGGYCGGFAYADGCGGYADIGSGHEGSGGRARGTKANVNLFADFWGLSASSRQLLSGLQPRILYAVFANFRLPSADVDVDAALLELIRKCQQPAVNHHWTGIDQALQGASVPCTGPPARRNYQRARREKERLPQKVLQSNAAAGVG
eukprot:TRINITY_DN56007_c0_g1_i1.p1 TRINITY_DN56007_c0_g1~~TRINITY_DN56007_c0_g1_i1.p1  ORF type:complete len:655 (-),score=109.18 TRINITY_DN56007_c0_g1_i1:80-2044(-)